MSLILRCPVCEKHYEANDEIVRQPSIQCPLCNTEAAASDFSAMMFCPHCRGKLAVSLDMLTEANLSCPRCEKTFVPTINISLDDDDDEDMELFADENEGKSSFNEGDFFDKYKIIRLLGRGGMGEVYLAEHLFLHREVALKIMLSDVAKNSVFAKRFVREAKIANKIESPNLIGVFDVGIENQTEMLFIAMEYVNGKNVSELIKENGVFDEQTTLNIAYHVVNALEAMEKENVVHRDIKPSNIMIDFEGNIKLADLGIAKSNNHAEGDLTLTQDSVVFGTPNYASPEQCRSSHNVDSRSDIYSLGATMYQMVTGEAPYTGETGMEIMLKVLGDATPDFDKLKGMSAGFTALLYDMMQKDPEKRPQNIAELKERLEKLLEGENIWQYKIRIMLKKALPLAKNIGLAILKSPLLLFKKRKKIDSALKHFCNFISFCILLALLGVLAYLNQDKLGDLWMKYVEKISSTPAISKDQQKRINQMKTRINNTRSKTNFTQYNNAKNSHLFDLKKIEEDKKNGFSFSFDNYTLLLAPKNITGEYKIPKGVKFISVAAFQNCADLKSIIIPDTVQSIESSAFNNCTSLQSVSIPDKVQIIGQYAFNNCHNLQIVKFSSKIKTINSNVFENCLNLQKIVAPSGLQIIGNNADSLQKKVVRHENDIVETAPHPQNKAINYEAIAESSKLAEQEQKAQKQVQVLKKKITKNYPRTIQGRLNRCEDIIAEIKEDISKNPDNKWHQERLEFMEKTVHKNLIRQYNNLKTAEERKQRGGYDERANNEIKSLFRSIAERQKYYGTMTDRQGLEDIKRLLHLMNTRDFDPNIIVEDPNLNRNSSPKSMPFWRYLLDPRFIPKKTKDMMLDILFKKYVLPTDIYPYMATNEKLLNYGINDLEGAWIYILHFKRDLIPVFTEYGADINYKYGGANILHWAVSFSDFNTVKKVLMAGGDINAVDNNGQTPLFWAEKYANDSVVKLLIALGSDTEYCDNSGKKASDYKHFGEFNEAVRKNDFNKIMTMLDKYPELAHERLYNNTYPVYYAAEKLNITLLKKLIEMKVDINSNSLSNESANVIYRLNHRILYSNSNHKDRNKMLQVIKVLLDAGAEVPYHCYYSFASVNYGKLDTVSSNCFIEIAKHPKKEEHANIILIDIYNQYYNQNFDNSNTRYAIAHTLLKDKKFKLNQPRFKGIFFRAASNPKIPERELTLLLEHEADINEKSNSGTTALYKLCMDSQMYVNRRNYKFNGISLNYYVRRIRFLLTHHAKIDIECNGRTVADLNLPQDVKNIYQIRNFLKQKNKR